MALLTPTPFRCADCGLTTPAETLVWCCPRCGGPLDVVTAEPFRRADIDASLPSLWRYAKAVQHATPRHVTLGEGWTPLVRDRHFGADVHWKCEFVSISGSFKDRGVATMMNHLIENGVERVAEDSSGNAGASVATYAAAAGLPCRIYVPAGNSKAKIAQIAATGAEVIAVPGSRQAVADAAMRDRSGYFYASHNWHPVFLEGVKTVGYEIWEQLGFEVPDAIVAPAGSGSNLLGCFRAFDALRRAGETDRIPRLYGAQTTGCEPLARAYAEGSADYIAIQTRPTLAEGIAVSRPIRAREILAHVRASGGGIFSLDEEEIAVAVSTLARRGMYVEPTTATAGALLMKLIDNGTLRPGERVVVVLTGSGLKASEAIARLRDTSAPAADHPLRA